MSDYESFFEQDELGFEDEADQGRGAPAPAPNRNNPGTGDPYGMPAPGSERPVSMGDMGKAYSDGVVEQFSAGRILGGLLGFGGKKERDPDIKAMSAFTGKLSPEYHARGEKMFGPGGGDLLQEVYARYRDRGNATREAERVATDRDAMGRGREDTFGLENAAAPANGMMPPAGAPGTEDPANPEPKVGRWQKYILPSGA